jgi:hypothetical protein
MQAKLAQRPTTQRMNACEGKWRLDLHGVGQAKNEWG